MVRRWSVANVGVSNDLGISSAKPRRRESCFFFTLDITLMDAGKETKETPTATEHINIKVVGSVCILIL